MLCYARRHQVPFFESLVWLDLRLNPCLPEHWQTLSPLCQYMYSGHRCWNKGISFPIWWSIETSLNPYLLQPDMQVENHILHQFYARTLNTTRYLELWIATEIFATYSLPKCMKANKLGNSTQKMGTLNKERKITVKVKVGNFSDCRITWKTVTHTHTHTYTHTHIHS